MNEAAKHYFSALKGKRICFIGAGVSHRELIDIFTQYGAQVTLCDRLASDKFDPELRRRYAAEGVELRLGDSYLEGLAGFDEIFRSPGLSYNNEKLQQARAAGAHITGEIQKFFEIAPCRTIAVTGSDGKTTTTTLIAQMLRAAGYTVHLGGNIGTPLLPQALSMASDDIAAVELSSFQLMSMQPQPDVALVTNVTPNHLDYHGTMEEYIAAKRNVLCWQKPQQTAVLNDDCAVTRGFAGAVRGKLRLFSSEHALSDGAYIADGWVNIARGGHSERVIEVSKIALRGFHNAVNVAAAAAAVMELCPAHCIAEVACTFTGVEHRIEPVRTLRGVQYYNDSIATSPTRTVAGLRAFGDKKMILIAGGYDKKISYVPLAPELVAHVKLLILTGATAPKIEAALRECPNYTGSPCIVHAKDLAAAVSAAASSAADGDIVMLSPASASFDCFRNFEERGRCFKELVAALS